MIVRPVRAPAAREATAILFCGKTTIDVMGSLWYADPTPYLRGKGAPGSAVNRPVVGSEGGIGSCQSLPWPEPNVAK